MAIARLASHFALARTTAPVVLLESLESTPVRTVFFLSVFNPAANSANYIFKIQRVVIDPDREERVFRIFRDTAALGETWTFGTLGGKFLVGPNERLEIISETAPANEPLEVVIDYTELA